MQLNQAVDRVVEREETRTADLGGDLSTSEITEKLIETIVQGYGDEPG